MTKEPFTWKRRPPRPPRSIKLRKIGITPETAPNMADVVKGILGAAEATVQRKKAFRDTWHKRLMERRNRLLGWPLPRVRPKEKACSTCKEVKAAKLFSRSKRTPTLLANECKECRRSRYLQGSRSVARRYRTKLSKSQLNPR